MRVKSYKLSKLAFCLSLLAAGGCSTLERIAPPGFVKYEDLEKDTPPNPEIQARVEARKMSGERSFPNLSQTPSANPAAPAAAELEAERTRLLAERDALNANAAEDREAAEIERLLETAELESKRDTLAAEVDAQRKKAESDRRTRPQ